MPRPTSQGMSELFRQRTISWTIEYVTHGRTSTATWIVRFLYITPLLWVAGGLFWLVPIFSPYAPGHHLYVVLLIVWPFLLLLTFGSVCSLLLARRQRIESLGRARTAIIASLQVLLVAIFAVGSIPILTFNLAPEQSVAATAIQTPFGLIAVVAIVTEWAFLLRRRSVTPLT